jgi:hypothetical protein
MGAYHHQSAHDCRNLLLSSGTKRRVVIPPFPSVLSSSSSTALPPDYAGFSSSSPAVVADWVFSEMADSACVATKVAALGTFLAARNRRMWCVQEENSDRLAALIGG